MGTLTQPEAAIAPRRLVIAPSRDHLWLTCSLLAATLLVIAAFLPLWNMTLKAPQYPKGVHLTAYGTRMEGELQEVNTLNHYVGVRPIKPDSIRELKLFPFAVAGAVVLAAAAAFFARRGRTRLLVALVFWAFPLGMLIDLQYWLYDYGHDLNPEAPMRIDTFTPKVLGATKVVNFHSETMVSWGFALMSLAALLVSFGPASFRFLRESWNNTAPAALPLAGLLLLSLAMFALPANRAHASEIPSLSELIARSSPGGTLAVPPGIYHGAIRIDRPLTLIGVGKPVIDGDGAGDVVTIAAEGVTLRGFVIQGSARAVTDEPAGIRVLAGSATIEDNELRQVLYGIVLVDSDNHIVRGNHVQSFREYNAERRGHAIYLWHSINNRVEDNVVEFAKDGIFLGFANNNHIEGNHVEDVRYGIHYMYADDNTFTSNVFRKGVAGAAIMFSRNITFTNNEFSDNRSLASGFGILFKDVDGLEMTGNVIHHNRLGMMLEGVPHTPGARTVIGNNLIAFNQTALELATTTSAVFSENTFVGNLNQVTASGGSLEHRNTWSADGRGNYWDEYRGYDANGDGVGDIPYRYETAYDALTQDNDGLRAYAFTPARTALDMAARWFPVYRPAPNVVDDHPLISPPMRLRGEATRGERITSGLVGATMLALPLTVAWLAAGALQRRWRPC